MISIGSNDFASSPYNIFMELNSVSPFLRALAKMPCHSIRSYDYFCSRDWYAAENMQKVTCIYAHPFWEECEYLYAA